MSTTDELPPAAPPDSEPTRRVETVRSTPPTRALRVLQSTFVILFTDVAALALGVGLADRFDRAALIYVALVPAWLALLGFYRLRIAPTVQTDLLPLLGALACPAFVLALINQPATDRLLHDAPLTTGLVLLGRLFSYQFQRTVRARYRGGVATLIVGAGVLGCQVAQVLADHPAYGMRPVGFVDGFPDDGTLPLPLLGAIDAFDSVVQETGAKRVIVAFGASRESDLAAVLRASVDAHVEVHILPRLFEIGVAPAGPDTDMVWGFPLQRARRAALRGPAWRTKRIMDVVVSMAAIILLSPLMLAVALAVKLTSRGPVLFRQRRVGQRGEVVEIGKFRSMRVNAEADTRWGAGLDRRVTPVGRLIRVTSIDELPQMLSVLRGDMSLVGPRPERPHFADQFDQHIVRYRDRLRVPVGVTGWAQVHGLRGDTSIEERARFDNYYIEHWSLWFDIVILARTVSQVFKEVWRAIRPAQVIVLPADGSELQPEVSVDTEGLLRSSTPGE
jgi:exopolysaccharide biosynthesis polyprenyl glycosylphosphotransferase